jgi:hypothetical protein
LALTLLTGSLKIENTEKKPCEDEAEIREMQLRVNRCQDSLEPSEGAWPCWHLDFGLLGYEGMKE